MERIRQGYEKIIQKRQVLLETSRQRENERFCVAETFSRHAERDTTFRRKREYLLRYKTEWNRAKVSASDGKTVRGAVFILYN